MLRSLFIKIGIICSLCMPFHLKAQTSINGTITHAPNANAVGLIDAGSKAYAIKYQGDAVALYEAMENFLLAKKYRKINSNIGRIITIYNDSAKVVKGKKQYEATYTRLQNTITQINVETNERNAKLQSLQAETNAKFEVFDQQTAKALSQLKLKAGDNRAIADATGNFTLKVTPDKYIVLLISNNKNGLTTTEVSGKVFVQLVEVKEGETITINHKFFND
ncbi:hypothetical protein ACFOWM_03070 [Ferruginibacter yonginensis]|uniref:Uncharacterized protein n=1 Tax=Ferruginibacter yonginensis TaxID=1310416 RepID=A0ABV8QQ67_9BACT